MSGFRGFRFVGCRGTANSQISVEIAVTAYIQLLTSLTDDSMITHWRIAFSQQHSQLDEAKLTVDDRDGSAAQSRA